MRRQYPPKTVWWHQQNERQKISPPTLQLVIKNVRDLLGLDAEVIQGLLLGRVVEAYHQRGDIHPVSNSLVVSPGFAQRMRAVVALEFNSLAPGLYQIVNAGDL